MVIRLTKEASALLWYMICEPSGQWKREDWYRPEDVTGEREMAQLHRWVENKAVIKSKATRPIHPARPETQEVDVVNFQEGVMSMKRELVFRAREAAQHYRKLKQGSLLPVHFSDLEIGLTNKDPKGETGDDPEDLAELEKAKVSEK